MKKGKGKPSREFFVVEWGLEEWPLKCDLCEHNTEDGVLEIFIRQEHKQICLSCLEKKFEGVFKREV